MNARRTLRRQFREVTVPTDPVPVGLGEWSDYRGRNLFTVPAPDACEGCGAPTGGLLRCDDCLERGD